MLGYRNDMYMQSCDGSGWSWGEQSWGAGYDQVQYDCSAWGDYQHQQHQQQSGCGWGEAPTQSSSVPKPGSELLTELRLAELKRLIDRDAKDLKATSQGFDIESSDRAESTRAPTPDSNEESPNKEDSSSAHSLSQAQGAAQASASAEAPRPPPPGLHAPEEEAFIAVADFLPESRMYGEMPVRIGEEVLVSGEACDGWIFGVKRGKGGEDEGWFPVSALHIEELELEFDPLLSAQQAGSQSSTSRRGNAQQSPQSSAATGGKNTRKAAAAAPQQRGAPAAAPGRKGASRGKGAAKGDDDEDDEPWHEHGNWWSRQRHLNEIANQPGVPAASRRSAHRAAPPPPPPAHADEWQQGRRSGGKGGGKAAASGRLEVDAPRTKKKQARQRPALTSMLDRLNKPLVPPSPREGR